jgi:4-amino-4-deoxy-L-arabinose transferase-like glycosyltransferase
MQNVARQTLWIALLGITAITAFRVAVLAASHLELYPDEAQYWWWAQHPDWGYFSKPPFIAWLIRATTFLLGDQEWAIRISVPLLHGATALVIYAVARIAFPAAPRVALLSALAYVTLPGVSWSSGQASTDVPLLLFWALALASLLRGIESPTALWPALCGTALGFGFLAKYAMVYFVVGVAIACVLDRRVLFWIAGWRGVLALAIAAVIAAPNIVWNWHHGFSTLDHIRTNADWSRAHPSILRAAGFIAGQFGVFGPVLMSAFVSSAWRLRAERSARVLLAMSAPALLLLTGQAFLAGANANWAATAYVVALPLAMVELELWGRGWLRGSFVLHVGIVLLLAIFSIDPELAGRVGLGNPFKRQEGWRALSAAVAAETRRAHFDAVAASNRSVTAELLYYLPHDSPPVRIWDGQVHSRNQFDMTIRLVPPAGHTLLVLAPSEASAVLSSFESARVLQVLSTPVGGNQHRVLTLYDARDYRGAK